MLEGSKLTARDVMTRDVVVVLPDTSLRYVAKLLVQHRISGMPVVDGDGQVVGMVTENDLLQWPDQPADKQAWWLNMLADEFELAPDFVDVVQAEREQTRRVMKTDIVTVTEDTPVAEVAKLFIANSIKRVPVVRDGKLVGVVSRGDLVRVVAEA
jgi:CBS domain-containing protein